MKTLQEAFNIGVAGLFGQGWHKSLTVSEDGLEYICRYRGNDGRCCVIGWNIPNNKYKDEMEGKSALTTMIAEAADIPMMDWIDELQRCHDLGTTPLIMKTKLREFASTHSLELPQCLEAD